MPSFQKLAWLAAITGLATELVLHRPAPTHNPFDDVFNVSREQLLCEGYTEDLIECGYVNVTKQVAPGLQVYYQFFADEPHVEQKGFYLEWDSVPCPGQDSLSLATARAQLDAGLQSPIGLAALTKALGRFQITYLEIVKNEQESIHLHYHYPGSSDWETKKMHIEDNDYLGKVHLAILGGRSKPDEQRLLSERLANWWIDWRNQNWPELSPQSVEPVEVE
jgi:hypothetical protein